MSLYRPTTNRQMRLHRHRRVRARMAGTADKPRLAVFKSNQYVYAQLIDDVTNKTIAAVHEQVLAKEKAKGKTPFIKVDRAYQVGEMLAKKAAELKINKAVFDRGGFRYAGRVKAVADGARAGGLEF